MPEKKVLAVTDVGPVEATVGELLGLSEAESRLVDLHLALSDGVKARRTAAGLSQPQAAKIVGTSQPRITAIEKGYPGVSLDLMFRAFFALGGRLADLPGGAADAKPNRKPRAKSPPPKKAKAVG